MKSTQAIIVTLLLAVIFTCYGYSQDKIGFTIQKLYMQGYEAKAMGTVTFYNSFKEMEIRQYILPKDGKIPKNPEYKIQRYKLDGKRIDGEGIKEFENLGIVFCGTAMSENEPNINITTFLDKDSCSLVIPEYEYEVKGKLIPNKYK
ncbi:MAG: hypothetical protein PHP53_05655 [Prolixibacteraceae bacterium]|nr:hypothetical protein [Prolixibacteraceae bacterium]